ncbi:hypothetical protein [Paracoccus haeundaensis]|uniref:Uncharacterized protein n=1 Tax=Paracoccus haeundaensis TaxID=225362 RepID=A0A5C4RAE9_9RHOB|nr:hypothetical protein [Paracoccus haeundaensis]TNH40940.1 hypothetical protein FHD67_02625 [Paracoccus haeundaensis]
MPEEIVRRCSCCYKAITPPKGRGRPSLYCEECAPKSKQQKNKLRDIAKANRALAVLDHLTKRHNSLRIRGEIDEKVLFATLYAEIRKNPKCLPTDMRRALTRYIDPEFRKPKDWIPTFGTYFGRFCNEFRGIRVSNLVKLYPKPEEIKEFIDLEESTKAQFGGDFPYSPSTEYSAIELLMGGYAIDDSVIEEDAEDRKSDSLLEAFEIVDYVEPEKENIENAIYKIMEKGGIFGMGYPQHIRLHFCKLGYSENEINSALRSLLESGRLEYDFGQYMLPKPVPKCRRRLTAA